MKVKKRFSYDGIELRIVLRYELDYITKGQKHPVTRVLAPNGGVIPITIKSGQTLRSIAEETVKAIDTFKARGSDVMHEMTKELITNNHKI
jgi:hypothetical protein